MKGLFSRVRSHARWLCVCKASSRAGSIDIKCHLRLLSLLMQILQQSTELKLFCKLRAREKNETLWQPMKQQPETKIEFCQWREPSGGEREGFSRIRMNSHELVIAFCLLPFLQGFSLRSLDARSNGFISQLGANYSDTSAIISPRQLMASASDACRAGIACFSLRVEIKVLRFREMRNTEALKCARLDFTCFGVAWDNYVSCKCVSVEIWGVSRTMEKISFMRSAGTKPIV